MILTSPLEDMLIVELTIEDEQEVQHLCMEDYDILLGLDY